VSLALPVIEEVIRGIPYGVRMDVFVVEEIDWRIGMIQEYLSSMKCRPRFHGVASVKLDG
jgi:hypothetical protein